MKNKISMDQVFAQISSIAEVNFGILLPPYVLRWAIAFTAAQVLFFAYVAFAIWRSKSEPTEEGPSEENPNGDQPK